MPNDKAQLRVTVSDANGEWYNVDTLTDAQLTAMIDSAHVLLAELHQAQKARKAEAEVSLPKRQKWWLSPPPQKCDVCQQPITDTFIDGKTQWGPWACMCPKCHENQRYGLGTGRGQKYVLQTEGQYKGKWLKVEG